LGPAGITLRTVSSTAPLLLLAMNSCSVDDRRRDIAHALALVARIQTFRRGEVLLRLARRLLRASYQVKSRRTTSAAARATAAAAAAFRRESVLPRPRCAGVTAADQPGVRHPARNPRSETVLLGSGKQLCVTGQLVLCDVAVAYGDLLPRPKPQPPLRDMKRPPF
jgi:hypothetical protein